MSLLKCLASAVVLVSTWGWFWLLFWDMKFPVFQHRAVAGWIDSLDHEFPEQAYLYAWLPRNAAVLSIGGNIGTTCIFIDKLVSNPSSQTCVEPAPQNLARLESNKHETHSVFSILNAMLVRPAAGPLGFVWKGISSHIAKPGETPSFFVPTADLDVSNFTAMVIDCEGCFCDLFKSFPELLDKEFLLLEEDGQCDYDWRALLSNHSYDRVDGSLSVVGTPHHSVWMKHTTWKPLFILSHVSQFCLVTMRRHCPFMFPEVAAGLVLFRLVLFLGSIACSLCLSGAAAYVYGKCMPAGYQRVRSD